MYESLPFSSQYAASSAFPTAQFRYPYPVHINVPCFVTVSLKSTNFLMWETQIINLVESQGCIGFIDGSVPAPSPPLLVQISDSTDQLVPNPDFVAWTRTYRLIKDWTMGIP